MSEEIIRCKKCKGRMELIYSNRGINMGKWIRKFRHFWEERMCWGYYCNKCDREVFI